MIIQCWSRITSRSIWVKHIWFMNSKKMFVLLAFHIDLLPRFRCLKPIQPGACTVHWIFISICLLSTPAHTHCALSKALSMYCTVVEVWYEGTWRTLSRCKVPDVCCIGYCTLSCKALEGLSRWKVLDVWCIGWRGASTHIGVTITHSPGKASRPPPSRGSSMHLQ